MSTTESPDRYHRASEHLAQIDSDWAGLIARVGPCGLRAKPEREPYEALLRAVAYQQLHARAANAMVGRLLNLYPGATFPEPARLLATDPDALRGCGFSGRKIETLRGIAEGVLSGVVPSRDEAERIDDEALIARLVALKGIGRWTVEMLLIFTLEREDILPVDDFGVREGYRFLKSLDELPDRRTMATAGLACSPYRTVASWYLWRVSEQPGYTRRRKQR